VGEENVPRAGVVTVNLRVPRAHPTTQEQVQVQQMQIDLVLLYYSTPDNDMLRCCIVVGVVLIVVVVVVAGSVCFAWSSSVTGLIAGRGVVADGSDWELLLGSLFFEEGSIE